MITHLVEAFAVRRLPRRRPAASCSEGAEMQRDRAMERIGAGDGERPPRRLLIVSADMGEGHNATGRALQEAAEGTWPGVQVRWLDTLRAMGPGVGPVLRSLYSTNVRHLPWLYQFLYDQIRRRRWFADSSKHVIGAWAGRRLAMPLAEWTPDAIVCTYPMGTAGLAWLRSHRGLRTPIGAWVSDFAPHPFWVFRDVDLTLVMHEVAVPIAEDLVPGARLAVSGPPVRASFHPAPRPPARRRLGLPEQAFVAVVSGGSLGFGDVASAARAVLDADPGAIAAVVCGHNEHVHRQLLREGDHGGHLRALGWVDDMPALLVAADLVLTNAGGATALEALASGRPILMYHPIAAHGRANAALMAAAGLTEVCESPIELTAAVRRLRAEPDRLAARERAAIAYARRGSVADGLRSLLEAASRPSSGAVAQADSG
ncbi:MAG: MGDG synthase family glycosyltransferase [Candidatus Dormibacteraceae bacterium]